MIDTTFEQRNNVNKSRRARSRPVPAHVNSTQVYPRLYSREESDSTLLA